MTEYVDRALEPSHEKRATSMIRPTTRWQEFDERYRREAYRDLSFRDALSIFEAMWVHARKLNPRLGKTGARIWKPALPSPEH